MDSLYTYHDLKPPAASLRDAVMSGLEGRHRSIAPKFFYDEEGSRLFDAICELPEYYLTRTERKILVQYADEIAGRLGRDAMVIEPGAGSAEKIRLLLDKARPETYVAMDISGDYLRQVASDLARSYPWLDIHAVCMDFTRSLEVPGGLPGRRKVLFFPGSSLGNFEPGVAREFLRSVARLIAPDGALLIGVDTKKEAGILHRAYNDEAGITAAFNLNLLARINRELGADFDLECFDHRAFYSKDHGRVEMHLVSNREQTVHIGDRNFRFGDGDSIHTESSYKYAPEEFVALACEAGLSMQATWQDPAGMFAVYYLRPVAGC